MVTIGNNRSILKSEIQNYYLLISKKVKLKLNFYCCLPVVEKSLVLVLYFSRIIQQTRRNQSN